MNKILIVPLLVYFFYVWALAVYNFLTRVRAIRAREMKLDSFKSYRDAMPDRVVVVGRHFDNQFQVPVMFFIATIAMITSNLGNSFTLMLEIAFVLSRWGHSFEHLGRNRVIVRMRWYAAGWLLVGILWAQLGYLLLLS